MLDYILCCSTDGGLFRAAVCRQKYIPSDPAGRSEKTHFEAPRCLCILPGSVSQLYLSSLSSTDGLCTAQQSRSSEAPVLYIKGDL